MHNYMVASFIYATDSLNLEKVTATDEIDAVCKLFELDRSKFTTLDGLLDYLLSVDIVVAYPAEI